MKTNLIVRPTRAEEIHVGDGTRPNELEAKTNEQKANSGGRLNERMDERMNDVDESYI